MLDAARPPPLLALLAGGLILIIASLNALTTPGSWKEGRSVDLLNSGMRFRVGALLSIQMWTAIIGVGFGLFSYGFSEAHVHLFDWWCNRQAARNSGLDYGRYLNTLPRAPVVYGVRGFVKFATLRYLVVALSVGVSIGYKFGIMQVPVDTYENLDAKDFTEVSAVVYISDGMTDINTGGSSTSRHMRTTSSLCTNWIIRTAISPPKASF
ncbi:hypothetical protein V2G26_004732 [Clonostachys chloroleuca]